MTDLSHIQPGDILLYSRKSFMNLMIQVKTWSRVSHVEIAVSHGRAAASRNSIGCGIFKRDFGGIAMVLRPTIPFDEKAALDWFQREHIGEQGYDWVGLFAFFAASLQGRDNGKMFCSEFARRYLREGGADVFRSEIDSDCIAPGDFLKSPHTRVIWSNGKVK